MNPSLVNLGMLSLVRKLGDREKATEVLEYYNCIPGRESPTPACCLQPMIPNSDRSRKLGFRWRCHNKSHKQGQIGCNKQVEPTTGNLYTVVSRLCESRLGEISVFVKQDFGPAYNIAVHFVPGTFLAKTKLPVEETVMITALLLNGTPVTSVMKELTMMRMDAETLHPVLSASTAVDYTKHKYHRGRRTASMSVTIFGIYCREDKKGVFTK